MCVPSQETPAISPSLLDWAQITSKVGSLTADLHASIYHVYGQAFPVLAVDQAAIAAATR